LDLEREQARNLDALRETRADIIVTSLGEALSEVDKVAREEGRIRDLAQPAGEALLDRPANEL
jgi:hypothetical protein